MTYEFPVSVSDTPHLLPPLGVCPREIGFSPLEGAIRTHFLEEGPLTAISEWSGPRDCRVRCWLAGFMAIRPVCTWASCFLPSDLLAPYCSIFPWIVESFLLTSHSLRFLLLWKKQCYICSCQIAVHVCLSHFSNNLCGKDLLIHSQRQKLTILCINIIHLNFPWR